MSMFAKHNSAVQSQRAAALEEAPEDTAGVTDPLINVPEPDEADREEQRAALNAQNDTALESNQADVVVGDDAEVVEENGDVVVDADAVEVVEQEEDSDEDDSDLDAVEDDEFEIEGLTQELGMLSQSAIAIEQFGFNPTAAAIMQTTGLLSSTALETLALESITFSAGSSDESQMALEALSDKIKEKAAAWASKILHVAKSVSDKILGVLEPVWNTISGLITKLGSTAWDKTKAAGSFVKAHPYATIAAVIAAIAAVAGIVAFAASGAPAFGAKADAIKSFLTHIVDKVRAVKFPGGAISAKLNEAGTKIVFTWNKAANAVRSTNVAAAMRSGGHKMAGVAKEASATALGWSQTAVKAAGGQLGRAWDAVKTAWKALGARAMKLTQNVGHHVDGLVAEPMVRAGHAAGRTVAQHAKNSGAGPNLTRFAGDVGNAVGSAGYFMYVTMLLGVLFRLTRFVVVGGFRLIAATFRALTPAAAHPA